MALNDICLVYPYFNNPKMLARQIDNWNILGYYDPTIKIVLVDDCSDDNTAEKLFKNLDQVPNKELYRFTDPALWTMHEARNLGAMVGGEGYPWLFMSDIDIMISPLEYRKIKEMKLDPWKNYTFERYLVSDQIHDEIVLKPYRYHCNTYLLRRDAYMQINGYDVDYCGAHGGGYGGDGEFERQLSALTPRQHLDDVYVMGWGRTKDSKAALADADTNQWDRDEWKAKYRAVFNKKRKQGDMRSYNPIRRKWERII